jgi:transmembrane sensor
MPWPSSKERIARTADNWAIRSGGNLSDEELAQRDAWRAADPAHEAAWQRANRLFAVSVGVRRTTAAKAAPERRGLQPAFAMAGIIAVIAAGGGVILLERHSGSDQSRATFEYAATARVRELRLADGTQVSLDPGSAIRTDFSAQIRTVLLERGTARFDVAHDPKHPFVVNAADRKVTAIGTRFEVSLHPKGVVVTLYQGVVEVAARASAGPAPPLKMVHGQRLTIEDGRQTLATIPDAANSTGATRDVAPTALADIVAEANRTAALPIRLADPSLGLRKVEGRFETRDSAALAEQLGAALDLVVTKTEDAYLLSKPGNSLS